ncbi:MAG TPA: 2-hydroxyacid dehydrogenase [Abditibacteriaceae bacterium]|nr:2-hydroxyacid dehydrogenase [Abditibacteriaceae bacterium]
MKVAIFSTKPYDRTFLEAANVEHGHELVFFESPLSRETVPLAAGFPAVCAFVNDQLSAPVLVELAGGGTQLIALRCAGFNNVDLATARDLSMTVMRVPAYSPYAVAEHTVGLMLTLNRRIHRAYARVREGNFALQGLLGFDLHGRTVGVVGTGQIGTIVARIMRGFGCEVLAYDLYRNPECEALGARYVDLPELFRASDIVTLHCPLTPQTHHLIHAESLQQMKDGVMLINTGRGALIDTQDVTEALKLGKVGYLGLDVYEEEADLFFEDRSDRVIQDDVFTRLLTFPNVIITGHQGFFTEDALTNIAATTLANITAFDLGHGTTSEIKVEQKP